MNYLRAVINTDKVKRQRTARGDGQAEVGVEWGLTDGPAVDGFLHVAVFRDGEEIRLRVEIRNGGKGALMGCTFERNTPPLEWCTEALELDGDG